MAEASSDYVSTGRAHAEVACARLGELEDRAFAGPTAAISRAATEAPYATGAAAASLALLLLPRRDDSSGAPPSVARPARRRSSTRATAARRPSARTRKPPPRNSNVFATPPPPPRSRCFEVKANCDRRPPSSSAWCDAIRPTRPKRRRVQLRRDRRPTMRDAAVLPGLSPRASHPFRAAPLVDLSSDALLRRSSHLRRARATRVTNELPRMCSTIFARCRPNRRSDSETRWQSRRRSSVRFDRVWTARCGKFSARGWPSERGDGAGERGGRRGERRTG